jgi:[acyl-carrier-protein] S-malonyltransferase
MNPDDAYVVGGSDGALETFAVQAQAVGARASRLRVGVASHTARMTPATASFRGALQTVRPSPAAPGMRLLSGVDGMPVADLAAGLDKLAAQISRTVRWDACLQGCIEGGATAFLELGPGRALAEMAARACPNVPARSLEDFSSLAGARDWLASLDARM